MRRFRPAGARRVGATSASAAATSTRAARSRRQAHAPRQVVVEAPRLGQLQVIERGAGGQLAECPVAHSGACRSKSATDSPRTSRSRNSADRIRVLAVPSGIPRDSETSTWVRPRKNASSSATRCGSGRDGHGCAHRVAPHAEPGLLVDVVGRFLELEIDIGGMASDVGLASDEVDRLVPGEREQPGAQRPTRRVEAAGVVPDGHEDLLDHVLGEAIGARHLVGERVERSRVPLVERLDRALVVLADPGEEGRFLAAALVDRWAERLVRQARLRRRGRGIVSPGLEADPVHLRGRREYTNGVRPRTGPSGRWPCERGMGGNTAPEVPRWIRSGAKPRWRSSGVRSGPTRGAGALQVQPAGEPESRSCRSRKRSSTR